MKINPKELRLGNWFQDVFTKQTFKVYAINKSEVMFDYLCLNNIWQAQPIELTEDKIIKFGFELDEANFLKKNINNNTFSFDLDSNLKTIVLIQDESDYVQFKCEYVHQLQNLYFALIGEELKLTDNATL